MNRSDIQETLVSLYLRLNGYFVSGFIVHAKDRTTTEMDVLAVRFPSYRELEREVQCCEKLSIPTDRVDFIVGEVKGGQGAVNFNARFRMNPDAIRTVLHRFGAFADAEISKVTAAAPALLEPASVMKARSFPELDVLLCDQLAAKLRFVPFAAEQQRRRVRARSYLFADDLIGFIWKCFRPELRRPLSDDRYNYELWGPQFAAMVSYFKEAERTTAGTINDLYRRYNVAT